MKTIIAPCALKDSLRMIVQRPEPANRQDLQAIASRILVMGSSSSSEVRRVTGLRQERVGALRLSDPDQTIFVSPPVTLLNCYQDSALMQSREVSADEFLDLTDYPSPAFSKAELVRVITTDKKGRVLMDAYQDEKAYKTSKNGQGAFFSRTQFKNTRDGTWVKGLSSGMTQKVLDIGVLSNNSVLMVVNQRGGAACHDGTESCFYRRLFPDDFLRPIMKPVADPNQMYSASRPSAVQSDTSDVSGDLSESERVSLWLIALSEKIQSRLRSGNPDSSTVQEVARGVRSCFASYSSEFTELVSAIRTLQLARQNGSPILVEDAIDEAGQCYCALLVALASKGLTLSQVLRDQDTPCTETSWSDVSFLDALLRDSRPSGDLLDSICAIPDLSSSVRKNANPSEVRASARAMIQGLTGLLKNQSLSLRDVMSLEQKSQDYVSLR